MAQATQFTTSPQRDAAQAHASAAYGRSTGQRPACLTREANAWARESQCGFDELRAFGLVGARVGFGG